MGGSVLDTLVRTMCLVDRVPGHEIAHHAPRDVVLGLFREGDRGSKQGAENCTHSLRCIVGDCRCWLQTRCRRWARMPEVEELALVDMHVGPLAAGAGADELQSTHLREDPRGQERRRGANLVLRRAAQICHDALHGARAHVACESGRRPLALARGAGLALSTSSHSSRRQGLAQGGHPRLVLARASPKAAVHEAARGSAVRSRGLR
mmetsp:Transcript_12972/g.34608  ORF Transcript_12972/g.34608 Transcript_12972/m.34608 type:complete len:207 (+) Transcript_12972:531-1151(+)